ncbi:MAG: hypothetical protein HY841_15405 [Bacteroidetes bacterium]|nr:hypothetical protein [Bacteroidota bacterium]
MNKLNKEGHIVEELNDIRCSIVEKNVSPERVGFLKKLLEHNGFTVMISPTPPPPAKKPVAPSQPPPLGEEKKTQVLPNGEDLGATRTPPNTFTVGVTTISFHPMLAIYERSFYTQEGKPASIAYWNQEKENEDELYWMRRQK